MAEGGRWKKKKERKDKGREKQKKKREERREKRTEEEKRRGRGSKEEEQPNSLDVAALDQLCIAVDAPRAAAASVDRPLVHAPLQMSMDVIQVISHCLIFKTCPLLCT